MKDMEMSLVKTESHSTDHTQSLVSDCTVFACSYSGGNYFGDLAVFLANKVNVEYVLIGHLENENKHKVSTVALYAHGKLVNNMTYALPGTPCENVVGRNCCYYPAAVQQMFPTDQELKDLNIHSYIGSPLFDSNRNPLGIIVLMSTTTIRNAGMIEKALTALAPRTELEMEKVLKGAGA